MGGIVQMSKERDHTKGFKEISSMNMGKQNDWDSKMWIITFGENNLKSILFSGNERREK